MINVALCIRDSYLTRYGGDSVQVIKTKNELEKIYNIKCNIVTNPDDITNVYNIVHVFNYSTISCSLNFIKRAKLLNIKVVTSPIYWDYSYASTDIIFRLFNYRIRVSESSVVIARRVLKIISYFARRPLGVSLYFRKYVRYFIENSDIISPNSWEEAILLFKFAKLDIEEYRNSIRIVYNATDSSHNIQIIDVIKQYSLPRDYILQVGRIEYVKNQLNLLIAMRHRPDIPIVFVGANADYKYFKRLKRIADKRGNVYFIPKVNHDEIYSFYNFAKLHVLLSIRESPGLVNLEALQSGCRVLVSDKRFLPFDSYFSCDIPSCNPFDTKEIENKVIELYNSNDCLFAKSLCVTWEDVAQETYNLYNSILLI